MTDPATPLRCPYVGLQPYTEADIDYFFGRERDQRIIAANLGATRLTILYGASGVGKSSVLLAGVVPSLRARPRTAVAVVRDWRGPAFLDALKSECRQAVERALQEPLSIDLRLPLDDFLCTAGEALQGSLLIIFDQFEEYFLYHPESETGQTFDAELARAVNRDDVDASFLFVMREDGLAKLDRFGGRIPNLLSNTLRLQHLTAPDAEAAIRKPLDVFNERHAVAASIAIEDALVSAIIDQVRSGQVALSRSGGVGQADGTDETAQIEAPFLQLVMTRLWEEEVNSGSHTLRLATLERLGGAEKIVRMHLDEVMEGLDGARQEVCAKFFDRLVTPSGTKIACNLGDLTDWAGPSSGEVAPILETLCASRILRGVAIPGARRPSDTSYEIYNDVLAPAILDWRRGFLQAQERAEADRRVAEQTAYANRLRIRSNALIVLGSIIVVGLGLWVYQLELQSAALGRQAHSLELVAAAQNNLERDSKLGTLLALEAVKATYSADGSVTDAAFSLLQRIVVAPHPDELLPKLPGAARTIFFSPDGTRLTAISQAPAKSILDAATGSRVNASLPTIMIWDVASGSLLPEKVEEKPVSAFAISPNTQRVAMSGSDGVVRVSEATSGEEIFTLVHNHNSLVTAAVFSADGQRLATRSIDGSAKVSDANSGKELLALEGQGSGITALAYSPNAKWLAEVSQDRTVTVRDAENGFEIFKSEPGPSVVTEVMFNANGSRLATVSRGSAQNVTVWEVPSGNKSFSPEGQYNTVTFSPNGEILAGAGRDGSVRLWTVASTEKIETHKALFHADPVELVAFSRDSRNIATASAGGSITVWDVGNSSKRLSLRDAKAYVDGMAFNPDGTQLATTSRDGTVSVWNVGSHAAKISRIALSAEGRQVATSGEDGMVKIWDADTRRALRTVDPHLSPGIYGLAFSADGGRLAMANNQGKAAVQDLRTDERVDLQTDQMGSIDLVFLEDGKRLVIAGGQGAGPRAKAWEVNVNPPHPLDHFGGLEWAQAVALSGDGHHLAKVSQNRDQVEIWDEKMNQLSWSTSGKGKDLTFADVVLSHDGRYVASLSEKGLIQLWDLRSTGEPIPLHADNIGSEDQSAQSGMAFSPDSMYLATAHPTKVEVWNIANKGNAQFFEVADVNAVAFSGDGKRLATASGDGTFLVWSVAAEDLIARARVTRSLSEEECKQFHVEPCTKPK